ncbi:MAG: hypothetical protein KDA66_09210 [Planctomycetaceae bacterium]|nr:hypothetical protein [Planctomycetaceae bacterium]
MKLLRAWLPFFIGVALSFILFVLAILVLSLWMRLAYPPVTASEGVSPDGAWEFEVENYNCSFTLRIRDCNGRVVDSRSLESYDDPSDVQYDYSDVQISNDEVYYLSERKWVLAKRIDYEDQLCPE